MRVLNALFFTAVFAAFALGSQASAQDYPILPGDEIDLSVFARPDLSRIYRVRADGTISMHIMGTVPAAGRTPAELEGDVEALLAKFFSDTESATLEVAAYRPVIVSGDVAVPGAVPFYAGMDVRSAVALGGGAGSAMAVDTTSGQMRVSDEKANADLLAARLAALQVSRAQLLAASAGQTELALPDARLAEGATEPLVVAAGQLLAAREEVRQARARSQSEQVRLARDEAEAFAERHAELTAQLATLTDALAEQQKLRELGLNRSERVVELAVDVSEVRVDILESIGLEAAARQKLERAETAPAEEETRLRAELSQLLSDTEAAILETATELSRSRAFVQEFGGVSMPDDAFGGTITYRIHRRNGEAADVIHADPDTLLYPGDGLEVSRILTPASQ